MECEPEVGIARSDYSGVHFVDWFGEGGSTAQVGDLRMMEAEKKGLRDRLRRVRRGLSPEEVDRLSDSVCHHAQMLPYFQKASSVGLYLSVDNEVNPASLLHAATLSQKAIFLPVVDKERHTMRFVWYQEGDPLTVGAFGIHEPALLLGKGRSDKQPCSVVLEMDVLFVPLVAFDRSGQRLGYGGGFYDRALASHHARASVEAHKPLRIGLAYAFQEVPVLPCAAHDEPLDFVVTDQGCLTVSSMRSSTC